MRLIVTRVESMISYQFIAFAFCVLYLLLKAMPFALISGCRFEDEDEGGDDKEGLEVG